MVKSKPIFRIKQGQFFTGLSPMVVFHFPLKYVQKIRQNMFSYYSQKTRLFECLTVHVNYLYMR